MRLVGAGGAVRRSAALSGAVSASRRNGRTPRSSSASRQASLARATSSFIAPYGPASSEGRLRSAVSSSPTAATRIAAAVIAPNTHPVVSMVWANAGSGLSIFRM